MLVLLICWFPVFSQVDTVLYLDYPVVSPYYSLEAAVLGFDAGTDSVVLWDRNMLGTLDEYNSVKDAYQNAYTNLLIVPFRELRNNAPNIGNEPIVYIHSTLPQTGLDSLVLVFDLTKYTDTSYSTNIVQSLGLYYLDMSLDPFRWEIVPSTVDTLSGLVQAQVTQAGYYAVFARAGPPDALLYNITSYPNPFGWGDRTSCTISYALSSHADVTVNIFAPGGGRVYSKTFPAGTPGGIGSSDGLYLNQVVWDGRNENGRRVDSGGYLCIISTPDGTSGSWKIGVVR